MGKRGSPILKYVVIGIVAIVAVIAGYSLNQYYSSGSAEQGIVVCNPDNPSECLWQDHMHVLVIISVNGSEMTLPIEKGDLNKAHTHEERNVIHLHSSIPYDPISRRVVDNSSFVISNSLAEIEMELPEGGMLFVKKENGEWQQASEYGDYVWGDRDILFIVSDDRSADQVLADLKASNIQLPYLGAG
jgi:hypothetical protein